MSQGDNDEAYHAVLAKLSEMSDAWRLHRETVNRAIGLLAAEFFDLRKQFDGDGAARQQRQQVADADKAVLLSKIDRVASWQRTRLIVDIVLAVAIIAALIAFVVGRMFF